MKTDAQVPEKVSYLFWDTRWKDLSITAHKKYIVERILESGDISHVDWLFKAYSRNEIIDVIKTSKRLSTKTAYFFSNILNIPKESVLCIQKPYTEKQNRF